MTPRRLHRALVAVPLLATALATPGIVGGRAGGGNGAGGDDELLARGRELYETGCSSCHGAAGQGVVTDDGEVRGPSLEAAGEAGAFYFLSTGRMPLANPEEQPTRHDPAYTDEQIEALVAYVGSLGDGPEIPEVDPAAGDLPRGGELFRENCQACHSASGSGGALSFGRAAPRLGPATPTEVGAAVRVGPGQMPVFDEAILPDDELDSLVRYVEFLGDPEDPGGLPIGRTGPVPEGFVAWIVGMGGLLVLVAWIGTRSPIRRLRGTTGANEGRQGE